MNVNGSNFAIVYEYMLFVYEFCKLIVHMYISSIFFDSYLLLPLSQNKLPI